MQRYFSQKKEEDHLFLEEHDYHHIQNVMRLTVGSRIEVVYQKQAYLTVIEELSSRQVIVKIEQELFQDEENFPRITIAQSLVKEQKMDFILQKATELGAFEIIPYEANRSIVKITKQKDEKQKRWQMIVKEASEQSKRVSIPIVTKPMSRKEIFEKRYTYQLLCSVNETSTSIKSVLSKLKKDDTMILVIGPEGGFEEVEEQDFLSHGYQRVSLGSRVLRTETASLFVLSSLEYQFMR